jgi:hypothetical protein
MVRMLPLLTIGVLLIVSLEAFVAKPVPSTRGSSSLSDGKDPNEKPASIGGFFKDFMSRVDDQVDDFFNKRMGNGEVFYG